MSALYLNVTVLGLAFQQLHVFFIRKQIVIKNTLVQCGLETSHVSKDLEPYLTCQFRNDDGSNVAILNVDINY